MNIFSKLMRGFSSPFVGLKLIFSNPRNITYAVIPFFIGLLFVFIGYFAASEYLRPLVEAWTKDMVFLKDWIIVQQVVNLFLVLFSWIIISLINFLAGYVSILIIAGPFYALMVENIFKEHGGGRKRRGTVTLMLNMFVLAIMKVLLFAAVGIICFFLAFIPIVNLFSTFILVLLVSFDCADYAFEIDYLSLRRRFSFLLSHFWEFSGLAFAILCTGLVPGSFFILLPAFICGATKMYIQLSEKSV